MNIYSDEELSKKVNLFNSLYYPDYNTWQLTKARKEHCDEFGDSIDEGEYYYKYQHGPAFDDVIKLSRSSIEKIIFLIFDGNLVLQRYCDQITDKMIKRLCEEHKKYSPIDRLMNDPNK